MTRELALKWSQQLLDHVSGAPQYRSDLSGVDCQLVNQSIKKLVVLCENYCKIIQDVLTSQAGLQAATKLLSQGDPQAATKLLSHGDPQAAPKLSSQDDLHAEVAAPKTVPCHADRQVFESCPDLKQQKKKQNRKPESSVCDVCLRNCFSRTRLERHRRTHTGLKPYVCEDCGAMYQNPYGRETQRL